MRKINAGIVGLGFIGPKHIEALRRIGIAEVLAVSDSKAENAREKAEALGIGRVYPNYEALINDKDIEVVHICAPNFLHYPVSKAALEAGKHVICEKPMARNLEEAEKLMALASKNTLVHAVAFNLRYYPLVQQAREIVKRGEAGEILSYHGSYLQDWLFLDTDYSWRLDPAISGESRAVADIGSHWLDMAEYVTGLKIKAVCADLATFHTTRKKAAGAVNTFSTPRTDGGVYEAVKVTTEDYASILFELENGAKGCATISQMAAGRKNQLRFELNGTAKSISWNSESPNELWMGYREKCNEVLIKNPELMHDEARLAADFPGGHTEGFPDTIKQLLKKVYTYILSEGYKKGVAPEFPTFAQGYRAAVLCEAILRSSKLRQWIEI